MLGGNLGFPSVSLHLRGWGSIPYLLFASEIPTRAPLSRDRETTFPRSQSFLVRGHFHKARPTLAQLPSPGTHCHGNA